MRSLDHVKTFYNWIPNDWHLRLVAYGLSPLAVYGVFGQAAFTLHGRRILYITLKELHQYEAAKFFQHDLRRIFPDKSVQLMPPFIKDKSYNRVTRKHPADVLPDLNRGSNRYLCGRKIYKRNVINLDFVLDK